MSVGVSPPELRVIFVVVLLFVVVVVVLCYSLLWHNLLCYNFVVTQLFRTLPILPSGDEGRDP